MATSFTGAGRPTLRKSASAARAVATELSSLETIGEDFRKTLKEARAVEREAQHAFDTMVNQNNVATAAKSSEIKASESEIKSLKVTVHEFSSDHKMVSSELGAINDYVSKLRPQCEGRVVPYAERKAKRDAEITGLQEALSIIASDSPAGAFASFVQVRHLRSRV